MRSDDFMRAQATTLDRYGVDAEDLWIEIPSLGGEAHVLVAGDGPAVVLLNGIGVPAGMLAPLIARLEGVTTYAVDLPAYGLTDTAVDFADALRTNSVRFLREVLDGLGLVAPVIVANSLGSLWSSWLAIDCPDRVGGLVHVGCPAIVLDSSAPLPMRLLSVRPLGRLMTRLNPPSPKQVEQLSKMVNEDPLPDEIARLILATERLEHFDHTFLATLNALVRLRGSRPNMALSAEQLGAIEAPTLLVFAENDPMGGPEIGRRAASAMQNAELHVVPGGHAPWIHHADRIGPHVNSFLHDVVPNSTMPAGARERRG